jgi:hypothetical protein
MNATSPCLERSQGDIANGAHCQSPARLKWITLMMKLSKAAAAALSVLMVAPAVGQDLNPNGVWEDRWGTTFTFELCGDGTQLCGVLNDIQGDSRIAENLAYVNQQVVQADVVGPHKWEGTIALNGGKATAIVEMTGPDALKITGCRAIFCSSIDYQRVS